MEHLFEEFPAVDKSQWEQKVRSDLKTDHISDLIDIPLDGDIVQSAYCDQQDLGSAKHIIPYRYGNANLKSHGQGARYWANVKQITHQDPSELNTQSLEALMGGADGLEWRTESQDWDTILTDISLPHCMVALDSHLAGGRKFLEALSAHEVFQGYLMIQDLWEVPSESLARLIQLNTRLGRFRCITLKEREEEHGLREISNLLTQAVALLNDLLDQGCALDMIAQNIQLQVSLSDHYLWEIARLRALRILFHQILLLYGMDSVKASHLKIKAHTKISTESGMLQNTTQAMSAVLGGCDILCTMPHDQDSSASRIALNVSHILREESHFHRVADPVAGSYYLESLTEKICREVWGQVRNIENSGGYKKIKPLTHDR